MEFVSDGESNLIYREDYRQLRLRPSKGSLWVGGQIVS